MRCSVVPQAALSEGKMGFILNKFRLKCKYDSNAVINFCRNASEMRFCLPINFTKFCKRNMPAAPHAAFHHFFFFTI